MRLLDPENFKLVSGPDINGSYKDWEFSDKSAKSLRRTWKLWFDRETGRHYGTLQRSKTDDGSFDHDVTLPRSIVQTLIRAKIKPITIDDLLDQVHVQPADAKLDGDVHQVDGWYAVSTDSDGIIAYFSRERDAFRHRLDIINTMLNGAYEE